MDTSSSSYYMNKSNRKIFNELEKYNKKYEEENDIP